MGMDASSTYIVTIFKATRSKSQLFGVIPQGESSDMGLCIKRCSVLRILLTSGVHEEKKQNTKHFNVCLSVQL